MRSKCLTASHVRGAARKRDAQSSLAAGAKALSMKLRERLESDPHPAGRHRGSARDYRSGSRLETSRGPASLETPKRIGSGLITCAVGVWWRAIAYAVRNRRCLIILLCDLEALWLTEGLRACFLGARHNLWRSAPTRPSRSRLRRRNAGSTASANDRLTARQHADHLRRRVSTGGRRSRGEGAGAIPGVELTRMR